MAKKSQNDYDGVIYEPSDYIDPRRSRRSGGAKSGNVQKGAVKTAAARKPAPQSQFTIFYILTLVAAVTLCIVIFLVVFTARSNNGGVIQPPSNGSTAMTDPDNQPVAIEETTTFIGFIQEVVPSANQIKVLDIDTGVISTLTADATTTLTSRFGQAMLFSEFREGDMIDVSFTRRTNVLRSMGISSDSWEHRQVKDVRVDVANQTLSYGSETYKFGRGFMVRYRDEPYSISNVKPIDTVTIRGYKNTVWAVDIIRSHGTLVIVGKDEIIDGHVEIDTDVFTMLDSFEAMDLVEGERRLVIKGANVEPFVKLITINPGEVTTVDLAAEAQLQLRSGVLLLTVSEAFYTLIVNGELKSTNEPVVLPYGAHQIRIEKDEFEPWEETIEVNSPTVDLNARLERIYKIARLLVSTEPEGADIYVDNVFVGRSPVNVPVDMGVHTVMPRLDGYISVTVPVDVRTNEHRMTIELQRRNPGVDIMP